MENDTAKVVSLNVSGPNEIVSSATAPMRPRLPLR